MEKHNLMRTVRTLASAGAAVLVLLGTLGVTAGPAAAFPVPAVTGIPVSGAIITITEPFGFAESTEAHICATADETVASEIRTNCPQEGSGWPTGVHEFTVPPGHNGEYLYFVSMMSGVLGPVGPLNLAPTATSAPTVTYDGEPMAGSVLTADRGTWIGSAAEDFTYTYTWETCFTADADYCPEIGNSDTYEVNAGDEGSWLRVRVDVVGAAGPGSAVSELQYVATPSEVPVVLESPEITGVAEYGQTLHVSDGIWMGYPTPTLTYQWKRCDYGPCTIIPGATSADYTVTAADIYHTLWATVTATNEAGSESEPALTKIVPGIPPTGPAPTVTGIARVGETLTASVGEWTGNGELTTWWTWARCELYWCDMIEGATSPTYQVTADDFGLMLVARVDVAGPLGMDGKPSEPTAPVVAAPAAGRDSNVTNDGNTITVSGTRFRPDTDVTVVLHSDPVTLGIAHTDADGNFTATFTIPPGVPAGDHTLIFTGVDAAGNPITVTQAVTLTTGTMPVIRTGTLPVTGIDAFSMALAAAGLVLAGAVALAASRRQVATVA
jgi:LPXTG-motif cell wall-anchored protein